MIYNLVIFIKKYLKLVYFTHSGHNSMNWQNISYILSLTGKIRFCEQNITYLNKGTVNITYLNFYIYIVLIIKNNFNINIL